MAKTRPPSAWFDKRLAGRSRQDSTVWSAPDVQLPAHGPNGASDEKAVMAAPFDVQQATLQMRQLAWLMDESIPIPLLGMRIGVDGLLGLVPGVGDLISAGISSYIIRQAHLLGVPRIVLLRMAFNTAVDFAIGTAPFLGDLFDFAWKANMRNVRLVLDYLENPGQAQRAGWLAISGMLAGIALLGAALVWAVSALLAWLVA
jgi:hypothetical protein